MDREVDAVCVDLHRTLPGVGVEPDSAWRTPSATTETLEVGRYPARTLSQPARALLIALHAAHHGGLANSSDDLERAVDRLENSMWAEAARLADEVGATDAFSAGLRLLPEGAALARRLDLPANRSVQVALHVGRPPPVALGFEQLARAGGPWARAKVLARKFVPPPGFMRHWSQVV